MPIALHKIKLLILLSVAVRSFFDMLTFPVNTPADLGRAKGQRCSTPAPCHRVCMDSEGKGHSRGFPGEGCSCSLQQPFFLCYFLFLAAIKSAGSGRSTGVLPQGCNAFCNLLPRPV